MTMPQLMNCEHQPVGRCVECEALIQHLVLGVEIRTLAIKLYEAGEAEKRKHPKHIWEGLMRTWRDLPSESVAVWDAVAICAYDQLKPPNDKLTDGGKKP